MEGFVTLDEVGDEEDSDHQKLRKSGLAAKAAGKNEDSLAEIKVDKMEEPEQESETLENGTKTEENAKAESVEASDAMTAQDTEKNTQENTEPQGEQETKSVQEKPLVPDEFRIGPYQPNMPVVEKWEGLFVLVKLQKIKSGVLRVRDRLGASSVFLQDNCRFGIAVAAMKDPSRSSTSPSIISEDVIINGHSHEDDNPFAEYMWMENEEEFNRQASHSLLSIEEELWEEEFIERCFQEMLEEEEEHEWFIPARDLPQTMDQIQDQFNDLVISDSSSLEDLVVKSNLNPNAKEFVPGVKYLNI
ncbi:hypothetical protein DUI87_30567 [Hirundo rustica rustica]|uniref:Polyadenylate-binding protein-interacting protein 2 n=39 Tax=Telluraves TaxID=3073808 RepID=A0A3M0IUL3_HIRRU|nr:hypothetical protein DUI87_30567 [Hirundo rustica rustica]